MTSPRIGPLRPYPWACCPTGCSMGSAVGNVPWAEPLLHEPHGKCSLVVGGVRKREQLLFGSETRALPLLLPTRCCPQQSLLGRSVLLAVATFARALPHMGICEHLSSKPPFLGPMGCHPQRQPWVWVETSRVCRPCGNSPR